MTFLVDNREPHGNGELLHPWEAHWSKDVRVVRGTLETGDIAIAALPDGVCVERKTIPDLYGCIGKERERFERELQRGRYIGRLIVVSEGSTADLLAYAKNRGGLLSEASIIGSLAAFQCRFAPFFFAGSVRIAAKFTERLLRGQVREIERSAKLVHRTETIFKDQAAKLSQRTKQH